MIETRGDRGIKGRGGIREDVEMIKAECFELNDNYCY